MRILALYLREEIKTRSNGSKRFIERIPASDLQVCMILEELGHSVAKIPYDPEKGFKLNKKYDLIFNLCDGLEDEAEFIEQRALNDIENTGLPFTGNSLKSVALCNDKRNIKKALLKNKILTPRFQAFKSYTQKLNKSLRFPLFVKPACTDGAVGIYPDSVAYDGKQLRHNIRRVIEKHSQPAALVEEYIDGRDLVIPVLGRKKITVMNPTEIKYVRSYDNKPKFLCYAAKWDTKKQVYRDSITMFNAPEKRFSKKELAKIKSIAEKAYKAVGCDGYATVDARLDKEGNLFIIEVNPNCWIGKKSDTALAFKAAGIDYKGMINRIIKIALEK